MKTKFKSIIILALTLVSFLFASGLHAAEKNKPKTIYFTYTLHGNMNWDRHPASTIWKKFPETYQNVLDFITQHPEFKGQVQLSGQSFKTLQIVAPGFLKQVAELQKKGQINVTGTFYSEPVNVCMDGETNLLNASLGTSIINRELAPSSGFWLQEHAWNPQLPYILNKAGVDWVPIRMTKQKYKPFYAIGLDGSKIIAVPEVLTVTNDKELIDTLPDNAILLIGGDYEMPRRFIDSYHAVIEINKERSDVKMEWIRMKDYLKKFRVENEEFVNNSKLAEREGWDSYSRWTADPLDIEVHTLTKKAMSAVRAAKIAVFAGTEYARDKGLTAIKNPDIPIEKLESFKADKGIDWDIEHASSYPDVEPKYFLRNGEITLLSRAEHLLAWATNSDARGWWPLYERRQERMESFQHIIDISEELIQNALLPIGASVGTGKNFDRMLLVYNAEKAREVTLKIKAQQPFEIMGLDNKKYDTKIFRQGNDYIIGVRVSLPDYGYKVISLSSGGECEVPKWEEGTSVHNNRISITPEGDKVLVNVDGRSMKLSIDPFQLRVLAEMIRPNIDIKGWHDAEPYGKTRVSVCNNDLFPKIRIDRQVDWAVHLRQEYELEPDHVNCKWSFFMSYPTLIRKVGNRIRNGYDSFFSPEGLMARLETNEPGKVFYDVPYGVTDHNYPSPSYVCMQNFTLMQQSGHGVMLVAKTGNQAVQVNEPDGTMALALGASTASGPVKNPEMTVEGLKIKWGIRSSPVNY